MIRIRLISFLLIVAIMCIGLASCSPVTILTGEETLSSAEPTEQEFNGGGAESGNMQGCIYGSDALGIDTYAMKFDELAGKGVESDPYLISSKEDIEYMSRRIREYANTNGVYFKQTADVTLGEGSHIPIGTVGIPFDGVYDGDGHSVRNMNINTEDSYAGLFGFVTGEVKGVSVYGNVKVHYNAAYSHSFAGGIAGAVNNGGRIADCNSYVKIHGDSYVGGVVGCVSTVDDYLTREISVIENCAFYGELTADDSAAKHESANYFGGIVGYTHGAVIKCTNYGSVTVNGSKCRYIGGIAGFGYYSDKYLPPSEEEAKILMIGDCTNKGRITGQRDIGGIVGQTAIPTVNCKNEGEVSGIRCVGGVVGVCGTAATQDSAICYITGCNNTGKITLTEQYGGGICGYTYFEVSDCENNGTVNGGAASSRIGGIAGYSVEDINNCNNLPNGSITGQQGIGGIIGWYEKSSSTLTYCKNEGAVTSATGDANSYYIGGICGMLGSTNSVLKSENLGAVTGGGNTYEAGSGGIVGSLFSGSVIQDCTNRGSVYGAVRLGGIAGHGKMSSASLISSCVNYGEIKSSRTSGKLWIGGIIGTCTNGTVKDCINRGKTPAQSTQNYVSGTVGYSSNTSVSNTKSEVNA